MTIFSSPNSTLGSVRGEKRKRIFTPFRQNSTLRRSCSKEQRRTSSREQKQMIYGEGRPIPIRQGFLYKKTSSGLGREWKERYVLLSDTGSLIYYPNLNSYLQDVNRKEIKLECVTVRVPGQKPTGLGSTLSTPSSQHRRYTPNSLQPCCRSHQPEQCNCAQQSSQNVSKPSPRYPSNQPTSKSPQVLSTPQRTPLPETSPIAASNTIKDVDPSFFPNRSFKDGFSSGTSEPLRGEKEPSDQVYEFQVISGMFCFLSI